MLKIKRKIIKTILVSCSFIIISTIILLYGFPKEQDDVADENLAPSFSSSPIAQNDTVSSTSDPSDPISQPSNANPIHVSDSQTLAYYDQGLKLYYQRQFPEALMLFNQALALDPLCYEALNAKGATLAFQGKYDQGLALIEQALDLNPEFVYANFNQGLAYELAGRWDQAISSYHKALQLDNRDTWSYYGIASVYGRQGEIDKVLEYLQPAITLDPDVKEVARNEHDFLSVREDPRFQALVKP